MNLCIKEELIERMSRGLKIVSPPTEEEEQQWTTESISLNRGDKVVLNNGDTGVVAEIFSNKYDCLMDSTGRYHIVTQNGSTFFNLGSCDREFNVNWDKTIEANKENNNER